LVTGMAKPRLVAAKAGPHPTGGTWRNCGHGGDSSGVRGCCGCAPVVAVLLLFVHFAVAAAAAFSRFASCQVRRRSYSQTNSRVCWSPE